MFSDFYLGIAEVYDNDGNPQQPISSSKLQRLQCFGGLALFLNQQHDESAVIKKEVFGQYIVPMLNYLKQKSDDYHAFLRLAV